MNGFSICGGSGHGKTTFSEFLRDDLLSQGHRVYVISNSAPIRDIAGILTCEDSSKFDSQEFKSSGSHIFGMSHRDLLIKIGEGLKTLFDNRTLWSDITRERISLLMKLDPDAILIKCDDRFPSEFISSVNFGLTTIHLTNLNNNKEPPSESITEKFHSELKHLCDMRFELQSIEEMRAVSHSLAQSLNHDPKTPRHCSESWTSTLNDLLNEEVDYYYNNNSNAREGL